MHFKMQMSLRITCKSLNLWHRVNKDWGAINFHLSDIEMMMALSKFQVQSLKDKMMTRDNLLIKFGAKTPIMVQTKLSKALAVLPPPVPEPVKIGDFIKILEGG